MKNTKLMSLMLSAALAVGSLGAIPVTVKADSTVVHEFNDADSFAAEVAKAKDGDIFQYSGSSTDDIVDDLVVDSGIDNINSIILDATAKGDGKGIHMSGELDTGTKTLTITNFTDSVYISSVWAEDVSLIAEEYNDNIVYKGDLINSYNDITIKNLKVNVDSMYADVNLENSCITGELYCTGLITMDVNSNIDNIDDVFARKGIVKDGQTIVEPAPEVDDTEEPTEISVSKVTISGSSKNIAAGKKVQLKATVSPENATDKKVTWSSSNKKYATVNSKGLVTTKKAGKGKTVTITAQSGDKKAAYKINIKKGAVTKITISGKGSVKNGKSIKLKANVKAQAGAYKAVEWTSSNTKYATVSAKGVVKTKKAGKGKTVTITATALDGSGKKAAKKIKITK